jgi:hypothetical protein
VSRLAAVALAVGMLVLACGRTELELDDAPSVPVGTGGAGRGTAGTTGIAGRGAAGTTGVAGRGAAGTTGIAGRGAAGTTGVAGRGAAGTTGVAGTGGVSLIPCGNNFCFPGMQACCVNVANMSVGGTCIALGTVCGGGGVTVGCVDTPSCGGANVCCVSPQSLSSACNAPASCLGSGGLILCASNAQCPGFLPHCCGGNGLKVCTPQPCGTGPVGLQP